MGKFNLPYIWFSKRLAWVVEGKLFNWCVPFYLKWQFSLNQPNIFYKEWTALLETVMIYGSLLTSWLDDTKRNDCLGLREQQKNYQIIKGRAGWLSGESVDFYLKGTAFEPEPVHRLSFFKIVRGFFRLIDVNSKIIPRSLPFKSLPVWQSY